ncbi:hypothetical protein TH15OA1_480088 [Vibrio harveyi]|nr:hypothetical protein TH15OA1_480088 [Vibrio harveyi]
MISMLTAETLEETVVMVAANNITPTSVVISTCGNKKRR